MKDGESCYNCKFFKSSPTENGCLFTGAYNYHAHNITECKFYKSAETVESEVINE